jgi:hypothetical protein
VAEIVASGRGVMAAGMAKGQDAADMAAYGAGIAQ